MSSKESAHTQRAPSAASSNNVSLSRWVNERFPAWEQLLSAHDVARLTRRPRWVLLSMMMLGRFPRKRRFHGRGIGWLRSDVLQWLAKDLQTVKCHSEPTAVHRPRIARQTSLPLECTDVCAARRSRGACCFRRRGPESAIGSRPESRRR
jgi:predicted DNA-binding transcriptional regulator AlpA